MQNIFHNCSSLDEVKRVYRKLAMQHHPDRGGDPEVMKVINSEYNDALKHGCYGNGGGRQRTYTHTHRPEREATHRHGQSDNLHVWTTRDGTQMYIRDMRTGHICNTIRMLRRYNRMHLTAYYWLCEELRFRGIDPDTI